MKASLELSRSNAERMRDFMSKGIEQEGITNAIRHGNAAEIAVNLSFDGKKSGVAVRDNGSGAGEIKEGIGMAGIRERLSRLAGELSVENSATGRIRT
jgi:signal transduction histidine kinase